LPITLKIASRRLDPYTLTWYRFAVSALTLGAILGVRTGLPSVAAQRARSTAVLALVATAGLLVNYVLYLISLSYVSPTPNFQNSREGFRCHQCPVQPRKRNPRRTPSPSVVNS
jgi:hypothetical protein